MKTIMFSAVFGAAARPERIEYLHRVKAEFSEPVEFVAFNTSLEVEAEFPVINAANIYYPEITDPLAELQALLKRHAPDDVERLADHAFGELGVGNKGFDRVINKHIRLIDAFCKALDDHTPDYVYLWNQFNALHRTFEAILKRRDIKMGFFHDGVMPGSIALDVDAEMGEGWIAREPERFMSVKTNKNDVARSKNFLAELAGTENDRHPQDEHISVIGALELAGLNNRPIVFFAGQNDWHAGILPDSPTRTLHSPVYESTAAALVDLDRIAGEKGFTLLFKPHPLSRDRFLFLRTKDFPNTVILQHTSINVCIEVSSVVTTIASQACYVALQENCPVVMLGHNQLTGKGLTYDVTTSDGVAPAIATAMEDPLLPTRENDFAKHIAQLERAYLFDYGTTETTFYRRGIREAAKLMNSCINQPAEDVIDAIINGQF